MPSKNMLPKGKRRHSVKQEYRAVRTQVQEQAKARAAEGFAEDEVEAAAYDTAELMEPVKLPSNSPFAHVPGLVTSGPNGGKHPQEEHTLSQRRYAGLKAPEPVAATIQTMEDLEAEDGVRSLIAEPAATGTRLDAYLAKALPEISRARVVLLIEGGQVSVDGNAAKAKQKLKGGELIEVEGDPKPAPLNAEPEDIPLRVVYEDDDLAVVDKPAGMMVHAGSGAAEHNRGTLVNALLFHMGKQLSGVGGELRPGIVHRLDKQTSGLIVVAKNDVTHRKLGEMFAERQLSKTYLALVHGAVKDDEGTVRLPIARDLLRRIRMTTRRADGRSAVSHWRVLERIDGPYGKFTLLEVRIETGRTHQIRVHMQAIGHPVMGDFLYGAPHRVAAKDGGEAIELERNFLHAAELAFAHPRTGEALELAAALPEELVAVLQQVRG